MQDPQPYLQHDAPVLLLLLLAFATALACHHLCPCNGTFPKDSFQLLQAMAPSPPQPCHHQHTPFAFDILLHINHLQQAVAIALHILQHLFAILSSPSTPQHWDAQAWQDLLNNLQHYIHHLEQCVPANGMFFEGQGPHNLLFSASTNSSSSSRTSSAPTTTVLAPGTKFTSKLASASKAWTHSYVR
ncbi:Interferon [Pitangus sulphuratus]|nr:Interferon [Pitangus sulphuratus]